MTTRQNQFLLLVFIRCLGSPVLGSAYSLQSYSILKPTLRQECRGAFIRFGSIEIRKIQRRNRFALLAFGNQNTFTHPYPCFGKEAIAPVTSVSVLFVWRSVCCAFRALAHISVFVLSKEKSRSGFHRLGYLLLLYEIVYDLPVNASFL